jgi:hypothetical protein
MDSDRGDKCFVIDPITRQISSGSSKKLSLIKGDHNSEKFTFELPRSVEGHDMSLCNKVEVHFINVDSKTRAKNTGVYTIKAPGTSKNPEGINVGFGIDPEDNQKVLAEWLISSLVTKYAGTLSFIVRYACVTVNEDGTTTVDYAWNTAICSNITVLDNIDNADAMVEEYSDVLQEWYEKLLSAFNGNIDLNSKEAVKFWVGSHAAYAELEEIIDDCLYIITDDGTLEDLQGRVFELEGLTDGIVKQLNGVDGRVKALEDVRYDYQEIEQDIKDLKDRDDVLETAIRDETKNRQENETTINARMDDAETDIAELMGRLSININYEVTSEGVFEIKYKTTKAFVGQNSFAIVVVCEQDYYIVKEDVTTSKSSVIAVDRCSQDLDELGNPINEAEYNVYFDIDWNAYRNKEDITIRISPSRN